LSSAADLLKTRQLLKYFVNFLVFLTLLAACEGEESWNPVDAGAYFPLQKGLYQIYSVEEVQYSVAEEPQERVYELMSEIVDSFPSGENQYTYVIHRSARDSGADPWELLDTWAVRKNANEVIVSEGNISYVKIRFPLLNENKWDGNVLNSLGKDEYALADIGEPAQFNGKSFPTTITVEQERNDDVIVFRDERKEVYAKDAGLVYKELIQLHYCTADDCLGQQKVEEGIEMKMVITDYGRK
jgi:hypothetical protein